jgi:hypothetical protein
LLGDTLLFLAPSFILLSIGLLAVGSAWFALWLAYLGFLVHHFPRVHTTRERTRRRDDHRPSDADLSPPSA